MAMAPIPRSGVEGVYAPEGPMKSLGRHLVDFAGSGMILTGFLVAALALAAAPQAVGTLAGHVLPAQAAAASH